jgi:hypothetical protein
MMEMNNMVRKNESFEKMMATTGCADTQQNRQMWSMGCSEEDLSRAYSNKVYAENDYYDSEEYKQSTTYYIKQTREKEEREKFDDINMFEEDFENESEEYSTMDLSSDNLIIMGGLIVFSFLAVRAINKVMEKW